MDYTRILQRAFHITLNYKALWLFGFLLAATTAGSGGSGGGGGSSGGGGGGSSYSPYIPPQTATFMQQVDTFYTYLVVLAFLAFLLAVALVIVRYVSETALIRMVDLYDRSGEMVPVRVGWQMGWTKASGRIFLIDLVIGLAGAVVFLILFLFAAAPLMVLMTGSEALRAAGTAAAIVLIIFVILLVIAAVMAVSLALQFFRRACILEDLSVFASIQRGWKILRLHLGDSILMGIILIVIKVALSLLMIPLFILLLFAALLTGALPAFLVGWVTSLFAQDPAPWIAAAAVGIPVFMMILILPLLFLSGILETYRSSSWTLAYRELAGKTPGLPTNLLATNISE